MREDMQNISLRLISAQKHNSQIVTGFLMLGDAYCVELKMRSGVIPRDSIVSHIS